MPDTTPSLVALLAPRTGICLKWPPCFWKRRKFATKWNTLYLR